MTSMITMTICISVYSDMYDHDHYIYVGMDSDMYDYDDYLYVGMDSE